MKNILYLSGPIAGTTDAAERFGSYYERLDEAGYKVINPQRILEPLESICDTEQLLDFCLQMIDISDAVVLMPGWERSCGCNREVGYAEGIGKDWIDAESLLEPMNKKKVDF